MATVAIIGAGPAGKAAAREFITAGWQVVVYDKEPETGGLMRYGYPEFRMPTQVSRREADVLTGKGVKFRLGQEISTASELANLTRTHDAVLCAVGAPQPFTPAISGIDLPGVYAAIEWLHAARSQEGIPPLGNRVAIIGGGDTSVDAATSAMAGGATDVRIICRDLEDNIKAQPHEVEYATMHGVQWEYATEVSRIIRSSPNLFLESITGKTKQRRMVDSILYATGQRRRLDWWTEIGIQPHDDGSTDHPKVWVVGDARYGADRLAKAIIDGRKVARSVITGVGSSKL